MATTKTRFLEFTANADYTSDWIIKNSHKSSFNITSIMANWSGITAGTKDGVITIEITNMPEDSDFVTVADTITVNSASNITDNEFRQMEFTVKAYRVKYQKNSISGPGMIKINVAED
jgi:hypothetical protein